jgi:hypothetical protein
MANKKSYWLGEKVGSRRVGQISIAGKSYGIGESIPADKLDKKKLNQLRDDGCIGDAPFHVPDKAADDAKDKDIALLQGRVVELEQKNGELEASAKEDGDKIAGLELEVEDRDEKIKKLKADLKKAKEASK